MNRALGLLATLTILTLCTYSTVAQNYCPPLGPVFPVPSQISTNGNFKSRLETLRTSLDNALTTGQTSWGPVDNNTAYAIQTFATDSNTPLFEWYHSGGLANATCGSKVVDGDSIFRIASISKLLTVYTLLFHLGDGHWDTRITDILPELRSQVQAGIDDPVHYAAWEDVTLGALAAQLSGLPRDLANIGQLLLLPEDDRASLGLPPLLPEDVPPCIVNVTFCNRTEFLSAARTRRPVFEPYTTSMYSDTNFQLLAHAVEALTGESFQNMFEAALIQPLNLSATAYSAPESEVRAIIPETPTASGWDLELGESAPEGGYFSTPNDLSKIGRSILSSSLLDANTTRAWLKPVSHTSSLHMSVGRPWEIIRYTASTWGKRVIDIYTKNGDIQNYHTLLALIPEYNVGFSILSASHGSNSRAPISAIVLENLIPALEGVAQEQASANFAGTYVARDEGLNTSLTLQSTPLQGGLLIDRYISNGTDFLELISSFSGTREVRMYPTNLVTMRENGTSTTSWRLVIEGNPSNRNVGVLSACATWFSIDSLTYGNLVLDNFVFELDGRGRAVNVAPEILRATLKKSM